MQELTYENILGEKVTFGENPPFYFRKINGTGSTKARIVPIEATLFDGDVLYDTSKEYRVVDLTFHIGSGAYRSYTDLFSAREKLQDILALEKAFDRATQKMAKITYTNDHGSFYTYAVPELGLDFSERMKYFNTNIDIAFRSPSAYWRGKTTSLLLGDSGMGAFSIPFEFPISFAQTTYEGKVLNESPVTSPLEIWVHGNGESPLLENLSTGSKLIFDRELFPGEVLYINTDPKRVICEIYNQDKFVSKGFAYLNALTPITSFQLRTGENTIKYNPTTAQAGSVIVLKWDRLYEGV
ncbi:MAG: hypothetical protein GX786_10765 [Clostridiales bacterium]|nr:hypothetical protein [Clostridiales bacterium]